MDPATLIIVIVVLAILFGGFGVYGGPRYGPVGAWSPLGLLLVIVVILILFRGVH